MKGFLRILEAIMASLILIAVLPFFFSKPVVSEWNNVVLQTQALDVLAALHKNGSLEGFVRDNNVASLNEAIKNMLPQTIGYSVEINGIPNPVILLGCACTEAQIDELEGILSPLDFKYKKRVISIRISNMTLNSIDPRARVLFVFGYTNMSQYKANLDKFVNGGGTIFMFGDLTKQQVEDGYMNSTFGLKWDDALASSGAGKFFEPANVTRVSHRVSGYYINISGGTENDVFNGLGGGGGTNRITIDPRTVVLANQISLLRTNSFVSKNSRGRTVWLAGYDYTQNSKDAQQMKNLTKAAVMWASGESYRMDTFTKRPGESFLQARYLGVLDGFEPFEVTLNVWRLFF